MAFKRDSLTVIQNRVYDNYVSRFKPLDKTPRHNLLKVLANTEAGMYHQLSGDLEFLSRQIFPDTATGDYLRLHWSDRVPPLHATAATGYVEITGQAESSVPAGMILNSKAGKRYFTEKSYVIDDTGTVMAVIRAEESGSASNLEAKQEMDIISTIPSSINKKAEVGDDGITGGIDKESDEQYLTRVIKSLRNSARYGKPGDFAYWAIESKMGITKAWEYKNFGVFGALLVQVVNGNQTDGIRQVEDLTAITDYISSVAPPILFTVKTPEIVPINPVIVPDPSNTENLNLAKTRLKEFLDRTAKPGISYNAKELAAEIIDGKLIRNATVKINNDENGIFATTILQYPILEENN